MLHCITGLFANKNQNIVLYYLKSRESVNNKNEPKIEAKNFHVALNSKNELIVASKPEEAAKWIFSREPDPDMPQETDEFHWSLALLQIGRQ